MEIAPMHNGSQCEEPQHVPVTNTTAHRLPAGLDHYIQWGGGRLGGGGGRLGKTAMWPINAIFRAKAD